MKKFVSLVIFFLCLAMTAPCFAETVSADNVSVRVIKEWVSEKYGCKIDDDGDLVVTKDGSKSFVQVIPKAKVVRIFSQYSPYDKLTHSEMVKLANKFNQDKRLLRVYVKSDKTSVCDYYIIYDGGLNSENMLEALRWFMSLKKDWCDYVIKAAE